jgi:secondary thiamine-phosphate synthase enzyme
MEKIIINTKDKKQIVDISEEIENILANKENKNGLVNVFITHTTAALTCADLDPGTDKDMLDAFSEIVPKLSYRHPHDPGHVGDHIMSSIIGSSVTIPYKNAKLILGTWQRVILVEFDGPRSRNIIIKVIK